MDVVQKKLYRPLQLIKPYLHMKFKTNNLSGSGITSWHPYFYFGIFVVRKSVPVTITHHSLPVYQSSSQYLRQFRNLAKEPVDRPSDHPSIQPSIRHCGLQEVLSTSTIFCSVIHLAITNCNFFLFLLFKFYNNFFIYSRITCVRTYSIPVNNTRTNFVTLPFLFSQNRDLFILTK